MPTVQFAEVPNTSSISNKCCLYAIMVILRIGLTGGSGSWIIIEWRARFVLTQISQQGVKKGVTKELIHRTK